MNEAVTVSTHDDIALIRFDYPPVNAFGHPLREGMMNALETLEADAAIKAIAVYCAGKTFVAGADIREFGKPPKSPGLTDICKWLDASETPVVAVMHGTALGGGLELALACHARVGLPGLKVGLPEVNLGLLPGAGGTQRVPRIASTELAISMVTTGKPIGREEALAAGLLDVLMDHEPEAAALKAAADLRDGKLVARKIPEIKSNMDQAALIATRNKFEAMGSKGEVALRALTALEGASLPFAEGVARERALFVEALGSSAHSGLKHAFFAERAVAKIPEADASARELNNAGVIGGGTMGSGIATSMLLAGMSVIVIEMAEERVEFARNTIEGNLKGAVKRGKLKETDFDAAVGRLNVMTDMDSLSDVDIVVEAVFESMEVKHEVFTALDRICKPGAVLASNTSYLDVNKIAGVTKRPADVIGLHFFSPAHVMRLLEVVVGEKTGADVVATGFALAKKLKKIAVRAGVCDGFIGNRILSHYRKSTEYMVLDGAPYAQIDSALEAFGAAMGPYSVSDLAGLDIGFADRARRAPNRPEQERYVNIADRICEQGWFGRKTGKGYYIYEDGKKMPNPAVGEFIAEEQKASGITPREFTDEEIVERYTTAMTIEATRVIEEGIALRPIDVDATFLFGYGYPRHRGGPMHYADTIGAKAIVERIKEYAKEDPYYWQVPRLLQKMADEGTTFADMNANG